MPSRTEADPFPPEERQLEIARILSRAFLRLRQRGCCADDEGVENPPEVASASSASERETRLGVAAS